MFFKRTALAAVWIIFAGGLCAFDLQVGSFFQIKSVRVEEGKPVLPLARGKYANLRVLNKETYDFLLSCQADCQQHITEVLPALREIRPAQTRPGMWIADVSFGEAWLVTFLIFKNPDGYAVKEPEYFEFLDKKLKRQVKEMLSQAAAQGESQP